MIDRLFLAINCPNCAIVKAELDYNNAVDDDFRGSEGQELMVFSAVSNAAARELLDKYEFLANVKTPVLLADSGQIINDPIKVIEYLRSNGMTTT
jgi:glutaredoxin-related protein